MKRYAEGTSVDVDTSRGEITGILAKHGVQQMGWTTMPEKDELFFTLAGMRFHLEIVRPTIEGEREWARKQGIDLRYSKDDAGRVAKEWKRRWRATVLLLKAKLEFADGQTSTVLDEMMPYLVMANGRTLGEQVRGGDLPLLGDGK